MCIENTQEAIELDNVKLKSHLSLDTMEGRKLQYKNQTPVKKCKYLCKNKIINRQDKNSRFSVSRFQSLGELVFNALFKTGNLSIHFTQ